MGFILCLTPNQIGNAERVNVYLHNDKTKKTKPKWNNQTKTNIYICLSKHKGQNKFTCHLFLNNVLEKHLQIFEN